jgi:hypothetical protein
MLILLAVVILFLAVMATIRTVLADGYRRVPTR